MDVADGTVLTIAHLYPELLGTYGDGGNALVLSSRARRRGVSVEVQEVSLDDPLPDADIYLLGGGEDGPQRQATYALAKDRALARRRHIHRIRRPAPLKIPRRPIGHRQAAEG